MMRGPRRGDVYWVNLDPVVGTEIRKTRPAVVVSNDSCNRHGTRVVVLLVTGNTDSLYPGKALIAVQGEMSRVLGDQIRPVDKSRLGTRVSTLSAQELARVDEALATTLALPL